MLTKTFAVNSNPEFEISVHCNLNINPSDNSEVYIEATGSERLLQDLEIYQQGNVITIRQVGSGGNCISIGGITQINSHNGYGQQIVSTGGATYINSGGAIYVNGKRVDTGEGGKEEVLEPVEINIYSPGVPSLDLDISGNVYVSSFGSLSQVNLDVSGSVRIHLSEVEDLDVDMAGSPRVRVGNMSGSLNVDASGSCQLTTSGIYEKVNLDLSGSGQIETMGTCQGNYKVNASGSCYVRHTGEILGRVRKSTSGNCQVYVGD